MSVPGFTYLIVELETSCGIYLRGIPMLDGSVLMAFDPEKSRQDHELVLECLRGRRDARDRVVERLHCVPRILTALNHQMSFPLSEHDVADLSQDTLVVIWQKLSKFEGRAQLETWAYRFCFLELMNRVRKKGRLDRVSTRLDSLEDRMPDQKIGPAPLEFEHLEVGLDELGPPEADVIRLKHFEERTFTEIGEVLEISPNTAKTYYYRGIAWLRRRLSPAAREDKR